jgi:crossover junction endodeoxyribonuclease RusA
MVAKKRKPSKTKPYSVTVDMKPVPKGRPRMTRRGRVFTPAKTLEAEAIIREKWDGPCYEGAVMLSCKFNKDSVSIVVSPIDREPSPLRGDLDNYVKLLMDGLNGVAWLDDKQVYVIEAEKS